MSGCRKIWLMMAAAAVVGTLAGCRESEPTFAPHFARRAAEQPVYSFAIHPLHNPALLHRTYGPLVDYLNQHVASGKFRLISSRDYAAFDRRLAGQEFDFALPNPYQAIQAVSVGYRVFGKVAGDDQFRGLILVRRGSAIRTVADLRGKAIGYPAPTAVAATMLPQYFLHTHGVQLSDTRTMYVGSMESALQSLRSGATDAAASWPDPWEKFSRAYPDQARTLEVKWITPPLVNNALVVRQSIPAAVTTEVLEALTKLDATPQGRAMLASLSVQGFEPATDRTYDPVRRFVRRFSAEVRPLALPAGQRS